MCCLMLRLDDPLLPPSEKAKVGLVVTLPAIEPRACVSQPAPSPPEAKKVNRA
jgi:hypothetical protein